MSTEPKKEETKKAEPKKSEPKHVEKPAPAKPEPSKHEAAKHVAPDAEQQLVADSTRRRVDAILNAMPSTLRLPLIMRDMDDLPYEEIATALGIGLSAVKMRIRRAREQFRSIYEAVERQGNA